jgi:hypothetical protein
MFMRTAIALFFAFVLNACATTQSPKTSAPDSTELIGTWQVDLRPTPGAAEYFQELVVTSIDGKTFQGSFYGSPISQGRINTDWSAVRIAFVTEDQSGPYNHSAVLKNDKLEGLTNSTGRNFLSYWSATKR